MAEQHKNRIVVLLESLAVAAITGAGAALADWLVTVSSYPNAEIDLRRITAVAVAGAIGGVAALFRQRPQDRVTNGKQQQPPTGDV